MQLGHKYAFLHQSTLDDLVRWLLNTRDRFECESKNLLQSLQRKVLNQPLSPVVPSAQHSCISKRPAMPDSGFLEREGHNYYICILTKLLLDIFSLTGNTLPTMTECGSSGSFECHELHTCSCSFVV